MTTEQHERITEAIRRADSFSGALAALEDAEEAGYAPTDRDFWPAITEHVRPVLEGELATAGEEVKRLKRNTPLPVGSPHPPPAGLLSWLASGPFGRGRLRYAEVTRC